ncbi:unnamed protein product [Brachionus calyciflorus]|uniref:Eukaryotic translation initiation factor 5 n=1 Tax=Brachionus calyciflorus TaxID=104777 RepID=A0A813PU01_9BILA|nr:unnamed protein product [Brachionus calyciflorus]
MSFDTNSRLLFEASISTIRNLNENNPKENFMPISTPKLKLKKMGDVMIPVLKDTKDPHYRYKMPKLTAKIEGSGNGIKTVLTNLSAVAKSLYRPPSYLLKYFGIELGAQVTMNNDIFIVNGTHDPDKLLNSLYGFIQKFVLCPKCKNPETSLTIEKGTIKQKCIACGNGGIIPKLHKLTTYIINHPPEVTILSVNNTKVNKSSKSDKKSKGKNGSPTQNGSRSPTNEENDNKADDFIEDVIDDFGDDEFSTEALTERMREGLKMGIVSDVKESANVFYESVKEKKKAGLLGDVNVQKELLKEAEKLEIKDKSTLILSEVLFTENMFDEIDQYRILLLRFCNENKKAQKYLLGGYEKLVGDVHKDKLFNSAMKILKQFYDKDVIDEETIIEWANKDSKKYVSKEMNRKIREKVAPLIKWLKEAEEEDESEEEDDKSKSPEVSEEDDDDLFEFSHRVSGIQIEEVKSSSIQQPQVDADSNDTHVNGEDNNADDIDIDDI